MIKRIPDSTILGYVNSKKDILYKIASNTELEKIAEKSLQIKPLEEGYRRILINALGAGEYWGFNKRGDYFPENELNPVEHRFGIPYGYKTYETHGKVYFHHLKNNPESMIGKVAMSYWHDDLKRVFVLGDVLEKKAQSYLEKIRSGIPVPTSMGAAVLFDGCSICAPNYEDLITIDPNEVRSLVKQGQLPGVRTSPADISCIHIPHRAGIYYPELDKYAYMINYYPTFVDISIVDKPADVISAAFKKVASIDETLLNSSELSEVKSFIHTKVLPNSIKNSDILFLIKLANCIGSSNTIKYLNMLKIPLTNKEFNTINQIKIVKHGFITNNDMIRMGELFNRRSADPQIFNNRLKKIKKESSNPVYLESGEKNHIDYIVNIIKNPSVEIPEIRDKKLAKLANYTIYYSSMNSMSNNTNNDIYSKLYAASFINLI